MLSIKQLKTAKSSSTELLEKNLLLSAMPDTVLAQLMNTSIVPISADLADDQEDYLYEETAVLTKDTTESHSLHSGVLGETVDVLSKSVRVHLAVAKNVIVPKVDEMAGKLDAFIEATKVISPTAGFDIVSKTLPEIMSVELLTSEIDKFEDRTVLKPDIKVKLDGLEVEDIVKLMLTGSSTLDEKILELVSVVGEDTVKDLYYSFFTVEFTETIYSYSQIDSLNAYDKLNYSLVIYLLARKLVNDVQEAKDWNVDLNVYTKTLSQLVDYSGSLVHATSLNIARLIRTKQLIIRKTDGKKSVIVNGPVYQEWLKNGGKPEILLGVIVDGDVCTSVASIDKRSDEYLKIWNSYITFKSSELSNQLLRDVKDYLKSLYLEMCKERDAIETDYMDNNKFYKDNSSDALDAFILDLKTSDLNDTYAISLILIAKIRFYYTSAYSILSDMREAALINPDIAPREAALLAAINYVSDYISNQIATKSWV